MGLRGKTDLGDCFFDLYCVYVCIFVIYVEFFPYCLFVSNSQVIGCEDRLRNDLYCVGWGVKLYSIHSIIEWAFWVKDCALCFRMLCVSHFLFSVSFVPVNISIMFMLLAFLCFDVVVWAVLGNGNFVIFHYKTCTRFGGLA